jgi:peptidoglycan/LPS O-acetylase OafA/YrhL
MGKIIESVMFCGLLARIFQFAAVGPGCFSETLLRTGNEYLEYRFLVVIIGSAVDHPQTSHLRSLTYRPDIDGLRAIAVLSVVGFHAFPLWIHGGFIGVDIFFVISGFLISTIIFDRIEAGRFSFLEFYGRRVRRIFPALVLILALTYAFGWFALFPYEYEQLGKYIAAGAGFVSNIVLWNDSGYFDNAAGTKPLLHLWSLGIEEQFYIVWPPLVWLAYRCRIRILGFILAIAAASFALNIFGIFIDDVSTFYSPQTRFWELLVGALLAWRTLRGSGRISEFERKMAGLFGQSDPTQTDEQLIAKLRRLQSWSGASLIAVALIFLDKARPFPGWWALLPTIGAALIIAGGPQSGFNRKALSHPVMIWFGLISYPLYLWHWPLLSFAEIIQGAVPSAGIRFTAAAMSVLLAWLTYVLLEKPIRRGMPVGLKKTVPIMLMVIVGGLGYTCYYSRGLPGRSSITNAQTTLSYLAWGQGEFSDSTCRKYFPKFEYCRIAVDAQPTIALIGDSHANHFFLGLAEQYRKKNENLVMLGQAACPPLIDITSGYRGKLDWCKNNSSDALKEIANLPSVHTVILAANWHLYINGSRFAAHYRALPPWEIRVIGKPAEEYNSNVFGEQLRKTIELLERHSKNVILVKQIPELDYEVMNCLAVRPIRSWGKEVRCETSSEEVKAYLKEYETYFDGVLVDEVGLTVWDPYLNFCNDRRCVSVVDGKPLYRDDVHLSKLGSEYFAREILAPH